MKDPIVDEIRKHRDEHARKFNYDLDAICADLMERQKKSGHKLVKLSPRLIKPEKSVSESERCRKNCGSVLQASEESGSYKI